MCSRRVVLLALVCACFPGRLTAQSVGSRGGQGEDRLGIVGAPRRSGDGDGRRGRRAGAEPSEPEDFPAPSGRGQSERLRPTSANPPRNPGQAWDGGRRARPATAVPPARPNGPGEDAERRRRLNQAWLEREERLARRERDFDGRRREQHDRRRRSVR